MAQLFHRSTNTIAKISIVGLGFAVAAALGLTDILNRSPYVTGASVPIEQPVPFSHKHHVNELGIDCRYCHTSVETASSAGIPPTKTCMNCHAQIWPDSPMLEPVRESFRENKPIEWVRVHDLPDYVYFDHSVHVNKGIGCASCHGPVDEMPLTWRENTLHMSWCLECHRSPESFVRPKDEVFNMKWDPAGKQSEIGNKLVADYDIHTLQSCSVCHR